MRRIHLIVGLAGVLAFLITGQIMRHHSPPMPLLTPEVRMMYVSRHIYLLGAVLVNLALGLYLRLFLPGWRRTMQLIGSSLILLSAISLLVAFMTEPALGLPGRGSRSYFGLLALFVGVMIHLVASITREL